MMKAVVKRAKIFLKSQDGPTAAEYAVMMALIILVAIAGITLVGQNLNTKFNSFAGIV